MDPSEIRRKRGVVRRSITNIGKRLDQLERLEDKTEVYYLAQRLSSRLTDLDTEFKSLQYDLLSAIDESDEVSIATEQEALDTHYGVLDNLLLRIQMLLDKSSPCKDTPKGREELAHCLFMLERSLKNIDDKINSLPLEVEDLALLQQLQEDLSDLKLELNDCRTRSVRLSLPEEHELSVKCSRLKEVHFECCHRVKGIINSNLLALSSGTEAQGLKVPELEAPTFDGEILNWTRFWEQFSVSIDQRTNLSDAEKFVYLQQALNGGSAKSVIQGLSSTGEHYAKAVECLKSRYDRPRLIHQSHVKTILDIPVIKEGNGRELRRLHDTLQQHLRALDAADCEPLSRFITSMIQLKLDQNTLFEWQKHTQSVPDVPHFNEILEFIDLRARASESTSTKRPQRMESSSKKVSGNAATVTGSDSNSHSNSHCTLCRPEKHPLYYCPKFKGMTHEQRLSVVKNNGLCMNCLKSGHYLKDCKSSHFCRNCQRPHHTLLHVDVRGPDSPLSVTSNTSIGVMTDMLLMTCQVSVQAPDGSKMKARALLDPASSSSFISERSVQSLGIPRSRNNITVSGVAGLASPSPFATLTITPSHSSNRWVSFTAIVVPCVTSDLPLSPVSLKPEWTHLQGLPLADPQFGTPGRIDLLLGVDVYVDSLLHGRRSGPPNSPVAFKTIFGWVLAGRTQYTSSHHVTSHHISTVPSDNDILRKFWEIEEPVPDNIPLSLEDQGVMSHFKETHRQNSDRRFVVPLPRRAGVKPLGESRSQALRRYTQLEHSLLKKGQYAQLDSVMREYLYLGHAESVPTEDLEKPHEMVFYLPIHAVYKASSSTTKVRAVFDASAKSTSGTSLNDCLMTGPTVHSSLINVLLRFRLHRIAVTTDVSKMYRAIELVEQDRDLHRFLWRSNPTETVKDYRMTRLTFGVSSSSFIANMCIKQNALNHAHEFPLAAKSVKESFYVDDGLTGADNIQSAVELQKQLDKLFLRGGFQLHKWNTSDPAVLEHVRPELKDLQESQ